ncbi:CocE/NonD family hydrolase [soil metagenome]
MKHSAHAYLNVRVPLRDGVELATHIYLPASDGPFPVMFVRTPYDAGGIGGALEWTGRGFAYIKQDVRGCYLSDGEYYPCLQERADGEDAIQWICEQPWCNGRIAMYGGSYVSMTQIAAALSGHPALRCFTPCLSTSELYHSSYWGGAFRLAWQSRWTLKPKPEVDREALNWVLPLQEADLRATGTPNRYWRDVLAHPQFDEFWKPTSTSQHLASIRAPAFIRTGWFDLHLCDIFDLFVGLREDGATESVRHSTCMLVGPWPHDINRRVVGEEDFGEGAVLKDLYDDEIAFIRNFTQEASPAPITSAPLRLFIMGKNQWRDEEEWPLARTVFTDFFFASQGHANTAEGDGTLVSRPFGSPDTFTYDPANPVPSVGGSWDFDNVGPRDQSAIESRPDVLVYTSEPLAEDMEVTGPVVVKLFASSSAVDTDFTAKLVDLREDGTPMSVTDGIIRACCGGLYTAFLVPGQAYEFTIECNPTAYLFRQGHRLRVEISSSNFPNFSRNLNLGGELATETEMAVAQQTIFHSAECPSRIILPVIPHG